MGKRKKKKSSVLKYAGKGALFLIKSPYYLGKGLYKMNKKGKQMKVKREVRERRSEISSVFKEFKILHTLDGDYKNWRKHQSTQREQMQFFNRSQYYSNNRYAGIGQGS